MKKTLALLLVLIMTLMMLAACGTNGGTSASAPASSSASGPVSSATEPASTPAGPMELVVGCQNDIGSMYPFGSATSGVKTKRVLVYETLFWMDYNNEPQPLLAKSYESLGGGKYSVELFDYIFDSEGNHMTASDIVFTLDRYIEDGQNLSTFATLTDYKATGEYTVEFTFEPETVGQFVTLITNMHCVTQAAWENSPDQMASYPVGTAGYVLVPDETIVGSVYVFEKRDDYWQTDEKYICDRNRNTLDKVTAKIITDASTLAVELETGGIDFTCDIAAADRGLFSNEDGTVKDGYIMLEGTNNSFAHLLFNCAESSPCQDINLRQAICYAIDTAACSYTANGSFGKVCYNATNPGLHDSSDNLDDGDYFGYDVERAKELVKESSYAGETIKILVQPIAYISDCAPLVQQYCAQAGITVELIEPDMALYRTMRKDETGTEYDIELYGAAGAGDVYTYASLKELDAKSYKSGMSQIHIKDDTLQKLYDAAADASTNSPETIKAFLDYVEENCYVYGMYYCPKYLFGRDNITSATTVIYLDAVYPSFIVE